MSYLDPKRRVYLIILVSLFLASLACRIEAPRLILEETPTVPPTIVITEVITEVVTQTPAPVTPTLEPTVPPEPSPTPTFDPLAVPIYYPLPDCVASRLHIGDWAMVSLVGGPNGIRYGQDIHYDTVIYEAQPGEILHIVGGPYCSHGWLVWMVETQNGVRGYTPEGNGNEYWLLPAK